MSEAVDVIHTRSVYISYTVLYSVYILPLFKRQCALVGDFTDVWHTFPGSVCAKTFSAKRFADPSCAETMRRRFVWTRLARKNGKFFIHRVEKVNYKLLLLYIFSPSFLSVSLSLSLSVSLSLCLSLSPPCCWLARLLQLTRLLLIVISTGTFNTKNIYF